MTARLTALLVQRGGGRGGARAATALWWLLRIGTCLCFVGHGAFGLLHKAGWVPLFAVAHIGPDAANRLMPLIGAADVAVGILTLLGPRAALTTYAVAWTLWTAALRPLAGLPFWEFVERAGNYGVPLALLLLSTSLPQPDALGTANLRTNWRAWLTASSPGPLPPSRARLLRRTLAVTTALLLVGHAALALRAKPELVAHAALLLPGHGADLARYAGMLELALAALVLWRPTPALAVGIAGWKFATEGLFLVAGAPVWEVVERGGSYAAPLALAVVLWDWRVRAGEAAHARADHLPVAPTPTRA